MKIIVFVLLLISQSLYSQNKNSKKNTKELLQGTWSKIDSDKILKYEFNNDTFNLIKGDNILFKCIYKLKGNTIDVQNCGKEKLSFKIKKLSDSTLIMKSGDREYYNYIKVPKQ